MTRPLPTFVLTRTSRLKGNDPKRQRCKANVYRVMLKMNIQFLPYSKCNAGLNSSPTLLHSCGARIHMHKEFPQEQFFSTLNCANVQMCSLLAPNYSKCSLPKTARSGNKHATGRAALFAARNPGSRPAKLLASPGPLVSVL